MPYSNNKDKYRPVHPGSLISTFFVYCLDSMISEVAINEMAKLWLASVAEQGGLSLTWSQSPDDRFSPDMAHFISLKICLAKISCLQCIRSSN